MRESNGGLEWTVAMFSSIMVLCSICINATRSGWPIPNCTTLVSINHHFQSQQKPDKTIVLQFMRLPIFRFLL